jgi:excisionase family DNA binding protein
MARVSFPRLLTVRELADLLQVPPKTIYTWRYKGIGPPAIPVGRYLRIGAEDVVAWLEARARCRCCTPRYPGPRPERSPRPGGSAGPGVALGAEGPPEAANRSPWWQTRQ